MRRECYQWALRLTCFTQFSQEGQTFDEAIAINRSLHALGKCIAALASNAETTLSSSGGPFAKRCRQTCTFRTGSRS